jgi:hypothetical protein
MKTKERRSRVGWHGFRFMKTKERRSRIGWHGF